MPFDRLIRIGCCPHRDLLAGPCRTIELIFEDLDQIRLYENDRRKLVARAELELGLVPADETVIKCVRAAAIRVERPVEWHALDRVQRRAAGDFLISGGIRTQLGLIEGRGRTLVANPERQSLRGGGGLADREKCLLFRHGFAVLSLMRLGLSTAKWSSARIVDRPRFQRM